MLYITSFICMQAGLQVEVGLGAGQALRGRAQVADGAHVETRGIDGAGLAQG